MQSLYILRHGQTDWNVVHKLQGRSDIPLNDNGRQMAKSAALKYKDLPFDICFCSPLIRAKETAEILLEGRTVPIIEDERLIEISFGEYEGKEGVMQQVGHPMYEFFNEPQNFHPDGRCESLEELFARTGEFLEDKVYPLLKEGKKVLIVGHGAMNLSIINRIDEVPIAQFWDRLPMNCEMIECKIKGLQS